jgi:hypothetical protein
VNDVRRYASHEEATAAVDPAGIVEWNWHIEPVGRYTRPRIKWNVLIRNNTAKDMEHVKVEFVSYA